MARPRRKIITGWRIFFATVAVLAALSYADDREARSAPLTAFLPADTDWAVSSWDFPRAWLSIMQSDARARMKKEWANPIGPVEIAGRLATGIRPTPSRWRVWLGYRAVLAHSGDGYGLFAYPGLVMRWADAIRRSVGYGPDADGISRYRNYFYTWRSGYLIASESRAFVLAAGKSNGAKHLRSDSDALLTVQWEGEYEGWLHLRRGKGLPIDGQLHFACSDGDRPLTLPQAWPGEPILNVTTRNSADLASLWHALDEYLAARETYADARRCVASTLALWGVQAPQQGWDAGANELSMVLEDVDAKDSVPIPAFGVALRYSEIVPETNPFQFAIGDRMTMPFEWNGCAGTMLPLVGTTASPCFAKGAHDWIATTSQPSMARIAGKLSDGPACGPDVDLAIRLSWEKLCEAAEPIALKLGEWEALPRMSSADIQADVLPKLKAMRELGALHLDGVARNGTLKFSGALAQATEGAAR